MIFGLKDSETSWEDLVTIDQLAPTELHRDKFLFTVRYPTSCHATKAMAHFHKYWDHIVNGPQGLNDEITKEKLASLKTQVNFRLCLFIIHVTRG